MVNVKKTKKWIENLPIKTRLLYGYLFAFLLVMIAASTIFYFFFSSTIQKNTQQKLSSNTVFLKNLITTSIETSLNNHLQTIAEKNLDIIIGLYHQDFPEKDAKKLAAGILTSQPIGTTGFLYSVNSLGTILAHPDKNLVGGNISTKTIKHPQIGKRHGYLEFDQPAPHGSAAQTMSLYLTYFGPWDWIISASLLKNDFKGMVRLDDLRAAITSMNFEESGDTYVMDGHGNLIIHPHLEGKNIYDSEDGRQRKFIREICATKQGRIIYPWQDPGHSAPRNKLAYYDYIPEMDWIVVSSAITDVIYRPLKILRFLIVLSLVITFAMVSVLTLQISSTITKPIKYLRAGLKAASNGDFSTRLSPGSTDELGTLESYFNTFLAQVQDSSDRLHASEKSFRSIFENSLEGIFQFDIEGNLIKANPSFVAMLGYDSSQAMLEANVTLQHDLIVKKELWNSLAEQIISKRAIKGLELQIYTKSKSVFWCLLSARAILEEGSDKISLIEGFLSNINDKKEAQSVQEKLMEDLEFMVDKRTAELSKRISELERRDLVNRYLGEMGDMLQSCRSIEETFPVIKEYLKLIFPKDCSTLYVHDNSKQMIDQVIPQPADTSPYISMTNDSCWALRQGKTYIYTNSMDHALTCDHVSKAPDGYICIPLIAQGETMGLLHIVFSTTIAPQDNGDPMMILERKKRLCSRLADHLSLALANLSLQEKLKLKSIQDSLTGIANRRHMEDILQRQFYRMLRHNTPCSIIMLDVDHFKNFNDTYGHDMGDHVLKELGTYLKEKSRGEDLACRYGGEEFIIILADTDIDQAAKKAQKVREEIAETIAIPFMSEKLHITVSVGVATSPTHGRNVAELIKSADKALYRAKENGRNRVELARSQDET